MQRSESIPVQKIPDLKSKLVEFAREFELACILDSNAQFYLNRGNYSYRNYDLIAGFSYVSSGSDNINDFNEFRRINNKDDNWYLGYLSYDLKNELENLSSSNNDMLEWPPIFFFKPDIQFLLINNVINIKVNRSDVEISELIDCLNLYEISQANPSPIHLVPRISRREYISSVNKIQEKIQKGYIYEMNFCQEFFNHSTIDPYSVYRNMNLHSPSPFSVFFKYIDKFLLSSSPERFLKKVNSLIISQPIKGTAARGSDRREDQLLKNHLTGSVKERSENIMIVDLVRNDLSKIAQKNSVKVEELCGIYSFPHVHQMISTVSAHLSTNSLNEIIKATFPMGSMTGAPKIEAMNIIEEYESTKRGLYSGTVGYISPGMNFDFNVVIRSLQYHASKKYLSYLAGGAITALSDPEKEYEECLTKIYGIINAEQKVNYA